MARPKKKATKKKKKIQNNTSKWSTDLVADVIPLITQHLDLPQLIHFRSVCRSWRSSSSSPVGRAHLPSLWAFLPDERRPGANLLSLSYDLSSYPKIQIPINHHYIGSGFGWLVFANVSDTYTRSVVIELYLLNPVTDARIPLPHIDKKTSFLSFFEDGFASVKAVLSSQPSSIGNDSTCRVVIFKRGDLSQPNYIPIICNDKGQTWDVIGYYPDFLYLDDVVFHNGTLYMLSFEGDLFSYDFTSITPLQKLTSGGGVVGSEMMWWETGNLVTTSWGDLLIVVGISPYKPIKVTRFDFLSGKFVDIEDGEDRVVLLGPHASYCLSALHVPRLKKNCIYFVGNFLYALGYCADSKEGIYSMEDNKSEPLEPHLSAYSPPIFFIPSLT